MSWYNDKISPATAQLMLEGAGAGAKALGRLAKIPLDMADRRQIEFDSETKRLKAMTPEHVAQINALSRQKAAELGYKGKELTAKAKILAANMNSIAKTYVADVGLVGKKVAAKAKVYTADKGYDGKKYTSDTNALMQASKSADSAARNASNEVVSLNNLKGKRSKTPTIKIVKTLDDGTVTTINKPYLPLGKGISTEKKMLKMHKQGRRY